MIELLHDWQAGQGVEGNVCDDILRRVKLEIVLDPSLQLLALVGDGLAGLGFERGCFDASGPVAVLIPSYIPLVYPLSAADWILAQRVCQYSLAQRLAVC